MSLETAAQQQQHVFHVVQKQLQLKDTINNGVALSPFEIRS